LLSGLGISTKGNQTALEGILEGAELPGMGDLAKAEWYGTLGKMVTSAQNWFDKKDTGSPNTSGNAPSDTGTGSTGGTGGTGGSGGTKPDQNKIDQAFVALDNAIMKANGSRNGASSIKNSKEYADAKAAYISANNGSGKSSDVLSAEFENRAKNRTNELINSGSVDGVSVSGLNSGGFYSGTYDEITATIDGSKYDLFVGHTKGGGVAGDTTTANETVANALTQTVGTPKDGWIAMHGGKPYIYIEGNRNKWYSLDANPKGESHVSSFTEAYLKKLRQFKTGGIADFTGPAWLDGTPTKPEYILNAAQTERFFSLVDVLEGFDNSNDTKPTGDNYFDISINVEKLDSDYNVEQLANKIRGMIYDDATYRNVNAISHKR
jgi:hypothetical protein